MKKLLIAIIPLILFSCNNKPRNFADNGTPKSFQQVTYVIDTLVGSYEIKELKNITNVILNEKGEIKSAIQTNFSFEKKDGDKKESLNIYLPMTCWSFSSDSLPILQKYFNQAHKDTLIEDGEYTFRYDTNSRLIEVTGYSAVMTILYDNKGFWTQVTKRFIDERYGSSTYEITKREIQFDNESIKPVDPTYLTINGENIFSKEKKDCADYVVLMIKAGIVSLSDYHLSISDTYMEYEDEGTGAGTATIQLRLWTTNDGKDIIVTNAYSKEPGLNWITIEGNTPRFLTFVNNSFTEIPSIFPNNQLSTKLFYNTNYEGEVAKAPTYFVLPVDGDIITYNLGVPIEFLREYYHDFKDSSDINDVIQRTSVDITFDSEKGTFYVDNPN